MRNDTHLNVGEVQRDVLKGRDWLLLLLALSALVHSMLGLLVEGIGRGWLSWHVARVQRNSLDRMKEQKRTCKRPAIPISLLHSIMSDVCVPAWWGTAKVTWWEKAAWPDPCADHYQETAWEGWWEQAVAAGSCWTGEGRSWWKGYWVTTVAGSCWGTPEWTGCSERRTGLSKGGDETSSRCKGSNEWAMRINQVYLKPTTTQEHAEVVM